LWIRTGQQAGFININATHTADPEMERRIVENVASYGSQLGRIVEALDVVVSRVSTDNLTAGEQDALRAFSGLADRIAAVKDGDGRAELTLARLDRLIEDVQALERTDSGAHQQMVRRIWTAFPRNKPRA
jgi:hypothetical protein